MKKDYLPLSESITTRVAGITVGLEDGVADIYDMVSETTANLLRFWFLQDFVDLRRGLNFHKGQRQAILNVIYAHEILGAKSLKDLYTEVAPDSLVKDSLLTHLSQSKYSHPKYCLKMATGTGKTWVLQALLIWQLLNKIDNPSDNRFTKNFLIVAPGLIVYDRLLDALKGKMNGGIRNFDTSDIKIYSELFIPENYRDAVFSFVMSNTCEKAEIGKKATSNGLIAVTNWNALITDDEEYISEIETHGIDIDPVDVVKDQLPIVPSLTAGNSLDVLDNKANKGGILDYLKSLPNLMNFNDEAHHIHEVRKDGELTEVEWQKSLMAIAAPMENLFVQVDFSATPYNQIGTGDKAKKAYFPHIVVDFDLTEAIKECLVKSIALDVRKEVNDLEDLDFKAERDDEGNVELSEGQRKMLRAGLTKLNRLEEAFKTIDESRRPKMLVVCEDTKVTIKVVEFLVAEGLEADDVLGIDSGKKEELGEKEWKEVKEQLFQVDKLPRPRVIVSVLMLREGFDVNNICVIVPLRSSQANILLEQIVGRGLRLMWRGDDIYTEMRRENRELFDKGQEPKNLIDVLSIVEHPRYRDWYKQMLGNLIGEVGDDITKTASGDLINVGLVPDYEKYDFEIPIILRDAEELIEEQIIKPEDLPPFTQLSLSDLKQIIGKGDDWISTELQSETMFGSYKVSGSVLNVEGYNDYLSRVTHRISYALSNPVEKGGRKNVSKPFIGFDTVKLAQAIDIYIRRYLFQSDFDPFSDENWRILLVRDVLDHIVRVSALAFSESFDKTIEEKPQVEHRLLSSVKTLTVSVSASIETVKSIYERLPFPKRSGGLELRFMEWCNKDSSVLAFCKLHEYKHDFLWLRYVKEDGMLGRYSPDFIVRCESHIFLVETKAQSDMSKVNVQRKLKAATLYCERINKLPEELRGKFQWSYALLGESLVNQYIKGGGRVSELLNYARVRIVSEHSQQKLL
jgi:type III restriction enzyme